MEQNQSPNKEEVDGNAVPSQPEHKVNPAGAKQPEAPKQKPTQEEMIWGVISYLPMVPLATLVLQSKSEFCRLHGAQGLVIFVLEFLIMFITVINQLFGGLMAFIVICLAIFAAVKAFTGEYFKIPGIYEVSKLIPIDALVSSVIGTSTAGGGELPKTTESQSQSEEARSETVTPPTESNESPAGTSGEEEARSEAVTPPTESNESPAGTSGEEEAKR